MKKNFYGKKKWQNMDYRQMSELHTKNIVGMNVCSESIHKAECIPAIGRNKQTKAKEMTTTHRQMRTIMLGRWN